MHQSPVLVVSIDGLAPRAITRELHGNMIVHRGAPLDDFAFDGDMESVASRLERAVADVTTAVAEMRAGAKPADHYGG